MRRSGEMCGAFGGRLFDHTNDYIIEYADDGNSCTYHRRTYILRSLVRDVKSAETSWIAVLGLDYICVVTLDSAREKPDLFQIVPDSWCEKEVISAEAVVSVIPDTSEVQSECDIAASFSEYNEMVAINFLRKIFRHCWAFTFEETVLIAVTAFRHLLSGPMKARGIEVRIARRDTQTTMSLSINQIEAFLDVSYEATKSKSIDFRSALSLPAVSILRNKVMGSLETSEAYIVLHYGNDNEKGYHRMTRILKGEQSVHKVKYSGTSCIAVQGQEALCIVKCGTVLGKPEKPDLFKIFPYLFLCPEAIVSVALGSIDVQGGCSTGASISDNNEKKAVDFLMKKTSECSTFSYEKTIQTAIFAHRYLFPENLKAGEIEIYVLRKAEQNIRLLQIGDMEALFDLKSGNSGSSRWQEGKISDILTPDARMTFIPVPLADTGCQTMKSETSREKIRLSYYRKTQIWRGSWDSKLCVNHTGKKGCSGFSWIAVQGPDSSCVVTQDEVASKSSLSGVLHHVKGNDLFGINHSSKKSNAIRPFAAVSIVVDFEEVNDVSGHGASSAEVKTVEFLAKKMKEVSVFTYEITVQTAISALLCLTQKDLHAEEIKAVVHRQGVWPLSAELPINEIEEHLKSQGYNEAT